MPGLVASTYLYKLSFEVPHLIYREVVEETAGAGKNDQNLFREWQRRKLLLLEDLDQTLSAIELVLRSFVEIAAKLGEGREFAILCEFELHASRHLPHGLDLGAAAHATDRDAHVHGRPHSAIEEVGFEKDLAVCDRNDIGRDVGGNVARLSFNNWQRRE